MLEWKDDNIPISPEFDDIYYAKENGLEESRYVFLEHNHFPEIWSKSGHLQVAELGFGTGLNYLSCLQSFIDHAPRTTRFSFFSCEKYPLEKQDLLKALSRWNELKEISSDIFCDYDFSKSPWICNWQNRAELCVFFEDVSRYLERLSNIDVWMLDGFAPSKNPEMWQQSVFDKMAKASRPGAHFATFAAAGFVRRGLEQAGFKVNRGKGFGRKREMLYGQLH